MKIRESGEYKFLIFFAMLIMMNKISAMIFAGRTFEVFGFILPGGVIYFCLNFALLDAVTNNYGYNNAKKIILFNLVAQAIFTGSIFLMFLMPSTINESYEGAFKTVLSTNFKMFVGSFLSTISAYMLNCYIFSKLYIAFNGRHLWLRCMVATSIGELVYSIIWTTIFFYNTGPVSNLIIDQFIFKVLFEAASLPFTYLLVWYLNKHEQQQRIKYLDFTG